MPPGRGGIDAEVRRLERAALASPGDVALRERLARLLLRAGRREAAFAALDIDLRAAGGFDPMAIRRRLHQVVLLRRKAGPASWDELAARIRRDVEEIDPILLARAFPRRADRRYRANVTRSLVRYPAAAEHGPHRRLFLLAYTPGTANDDARDEHDRHVIRVVVETRSTRPQVLPREEWRVGGTPA